jgi:hypothetical protein
MKMILPAIAVSAMIATGAFAQTTMPSTPPTATTPSMPSATVPPASSTMPSSSLTLTDVQAKEWVNKVVYSSDGKNVGEVAAFARDASGKVGEMHADIGGFLGLGETRVRLMPAQFTLNSDRVTLMLTADQAKNLPKVTK